ncbi:carboxymuconolactone decarboxylase family protein [Schlesneria sp. DSM 10557]|uniref:carboxymuconolactone decarboxylase family protein n=1 Tax=Schlesneria sp. DSM 10557 TaxID=3044399 RepID=UPI0035A159B8
MKRHSAQSSLLTKSMHFARNNMAHIRLPEGVPGIVGLLNQFPDSAQHLSGLAQSVLRGPSSLSEAEREVIASYVSAGNECRFCTSSHAAAARHLLSDRSEIVDAVIADLENAPVDAKLKALLTIAGKVRRDGRTVTPEDVHTARMAGADDKAIHDTVLIAAMFCMYNRYVDGLATLTPQDPELYREMGKRLATQGYVG